MLGPILRRSVGRSATSETEFTSILPGQSGRSEEKCSVQVIAKFERCKSKRFAKVNGPNTKNWMVCYDN